jgi:hypothetical protein
MLGVDLDGSRRIEPAHVGWLVGPDGYRRIVWMIKRMINGHPTESMPRQVRGLQDSQMIKAHPTKIGCRVD